jgi:hypothetical protein
MPTNNIEPGMTFTGFIPRESIKQHIGIVLINDGLNVHYCFGTSQEKLVKYLDKDKDYVIIDKNIMKKYFPNSSEDKNTYVILMPDSIFSMLSVTFKNRIDNGEFSVKESIGKTIFDEIVKKILLKDTISEEIKQELRKLFI